MAKKKEYVGILSGAICNTCMFGIALFVFLQIIIGGEVSVKRNVMSSVMMFFFLTSSIYLWMRGAKLYIDYRLQEIEKLNQKRESASSPNENVD